MSTTTFVKRVLQPVPAVDDQSPALTLRYAVPADADALDRLAQLDSAHPPRGIVLVAEADGDIRAAISVDDPRVAIADPFRPTGELVALLTERARQLRRSRRERRRLPRVWPEHGWDRAAMN